MKETNIQHRTSSAELWWFVALAFAGLWVVMVPAAFAAHGMFHWRVPSGLQRAAEFSPTVAAVIIAASIGGRQGVRALLRRLLRVKFSWRWYALVLLMPLATQLLAFQAYCLATKTTPKVSDWSDWPVIMAFYLPICLLQEEIGWRGFFFDRLLQRRSLWGATFCMAGVWGLWHLPTYLARSSGQTYLLFLAGIVPASAWFGFVYSRTGSILLCGILHASLNAGLPNWLAPLPEKDATSAFGVWIGLFWLATIPVFMMFGKAAKEPNQ